MAGKFGKVLADLNAADICFDCFVVRLFVWDVESVGLAGATVHPEQDTSFGAWRFTFLRLGLQSQLW